MTASYKRVAAVKTTMDILEWLSSQNGTITGKQAAEALGLPYGTVMSHIATLSDGGYIASDGEGLRIGPRMSLFWLRLKAETESKRSRIDQALGMLDGI